MGNIIYAINASSTIIQRTCISEPYKTIECMNKYFCPQVMPSLIQKGIYIIIISIVIMILSRQILKRLKKDIEIPYSETEIIILRFSNENFKLEVRNFIINIVNDVLIVYILLIIYLNI